MRSQRLYFLPFIVLLACACAATGLQSADTFNQKYAYALGIHTAVLQATTTGVSNGSLTSADGEAVLKKADDAKTLLDTARTADIAGDAAGALSKLQIATVALTALQTYLRDHGSKP